jgi:uncharacterized protein (DUF697 family)
MATRKRKTIALNPLKDIQPKVGLVKKTISHSTGKESSVSVSTKRSGETLKKAPKLAKESKVVPPSAKKSTPTKPVKELSPSSSKALIKSRAGLQANSGRQKIELTKQAADLSDNVQDELELNMDQRGVVKEAVNDIFDAELNLISASTLEALFADGKNYETGQKTVVKWSRISLATILIPNSLLEYAAISGVQLKMLHDLSRLYGIPFKADAVKVIIGSILGGSVAYFLSDLYANWVKAIPVVGKPIAFLSEPAMAYVTTYAVGFVFLEHFENNGSFQDIELENIKKTIKLKISEKYKELIKSNKLTGSKRFFSMKNVPV